MTLLADNSAGLYGKYHVERLDSRDAPGGDKADARYFVLDYVHDPLAQGALWDYAGRAWRAGYESLAEDLWAQLRALGYGTTWRTVKEEIAVSEETRAQVIARMVELYGPDEDKWPDVREEGR